MTPEQVLDKNIMIYCGEHNWLCFHTNVGKVQTIDGRYFDTGLPVGWPDLLILTDKGRVVFCETKIKPRKPTAAQLKTLEILRKRGFPAFVAYNMNEFKENLVKEGIIKNDDE